MAFSWNREKQDNFDIYLKLIGSPNYVRLTTDPADDVSPAFSPDGRSIGFVQVSKGRATFIVIPSIGGPERIVAGVTVPEDTIPIHINSMFAWLPDGNWVVTDGLKLLSSETGEVQSLTSPPTKLLPDYCPAISPDGHTIAFSRYASSQASDIYLLNLSEELKPKGEPRRLTTRKGSGFSSAWTPNGREIIFGSGGWAGVSLWRVPASGAREPERRPFSAGEAYWPAVSQSGSRLAYQRGVIGVGRVCGSPSLRTGRADLPHPALQLVVYLRKD